MSSHVFYAVLDAFIGVGLNLVANLLNTVLQVRLFAYQFSNQAIAWLIGLTIKAAPAEQSICDFACASLYKPRFFAELIFTHISQGGGHV